MFYREAGQYKTTYAADMAIFPIRQDRYGVALILFVAFVVVPGVRRAVPAQHDDDPVPDPFAGGDRAQSPDRLHRPPVARHRRFHGRRRLRLLQARDLVPAGEHPRLDRHERLCLRARRRRLRPAEPAHQGFLSRRSRRWRRSSSSNGASPALPGWSTTTIPARSRCRTRPCSACTSPARTRRRSTRYLVVLTIVAVMAWIASNIVHGRIGRMWMAVRDMDIAAAADRHPPAQRQASRLRRLLVLRRRRRRADGVPVARRRRARGVQHQPVVPDPVHHHHRRPRLDRRRLLRRDRSST